MPIYPAQLVSFSDIRNYPPSLYEGIVVLKLREDATAGQVVKVLETFVSRADWLAYLKGRLAILEDWRVRFRPARNPVRFTMIASISARTGCQPASRVVHLHRF